VIALMRGNTGALAVRGAAGRTGSAYPALLVLAGMFFALVSSSAVRQPVAQLSAEASKLTGLPLTAQATISGELGRDRSEYHARATAHGPRIRNSGHDLVATFGRDGIVVDANAGRLELRLEAMGNGSRLYAAPAARPTATENRVEYRRGRLTEWYINGPLGLEQGFTIARPLAESRGPLTLAFAVSGTLRGSLDEGATGLRLALPGQRASLRYYGLAAWDAGGRELPAWLTFDGKTLRLRVEATGAAYPITIDPIFEQAKLTASDGAAFDNFGASIAISGDTVVVGSPSDDISGKSDQGSAYVFVKPGGGWASGTQTAKLTASDGDEFDKFGTSVAVSGDTVVVGAPGDDFGVEEDLGSAYVFVKPGGGWVNGIQTAKLAASNGIDFDSVGTSVGVSGDVAVAGAPGTDIGANDDQGSVYVYVKPGGGWVNANQTAELTVSGGLAFDSFGTSVAIDVDTIVGAAPFTDANRGAAYVYVKPGGGWASGTETARLTASDAGDFDQFGEAVSVSGDTVVVGARMGDGVAADTGAAYVYVKPAGAWVNATQTAKLTASDGVGGDAFGSSVSVDGDTIVAGSYFDQVGMMFVQGSAYLFLKPGGGWVNGNETDKLLASDGDLGDLFGKAVSVDGATIAVGAYSDDVGGASDRGSAYIFPVSAPPEPGIAAPQISAVAQGSEVGVFGRNPDNELWYRETTSGSFGAWTELSTSNNVASRPKAVMVGSDLYVFFRSTANDLRYFKRTGGTWGTEQNLGGVIAGSPAAAVDGDGDLIVAAKTSAGVVFYNRLASGGSWTGFTSLDGILTGQLELVAYSGNVHLFGVDPSGLVWFRMWSAAASTWGAWTTLNGVLESSLTATVFGADLYVFGLDPSGLLWYRALSSGVWGAWTTLDGILAGTPDAAATATTLLVFATNPEGILWDRRKTGAGAFAGWEALDGVLSTGPEAVTVGTQTYVFGLDLNRNLWYRLWNGTSFGAWTHLGGVLATE
jgi:hypothetical protein